MFLERLVRYGIANVPCSSLWWIRRSHKPPYRFFLKRRAKSILGAIAYLPISGIFFQKLDNPPSHIDLSRLLDAFKTG